MALNISHDELLKMQLSPHFSVKEAAFESDTADREGIDNTPNAEQLANMVIAASGMEQVRTVLGNVGIHINSWLRTEALEKHVANKDYIAWCKRHDKVYGGVKSWNEYFTRKGHPKGFCIDFRCPAFGTPRQIVDALKKSGIKYDQLIEEGTWVHISFAPEMRGVVMNATFVKGEPTYTVEA